MWYCICATVLRLLLLSIPLVTLSSPATLAPPSRSTESADRHAHTRAHADLLAPHGTLSDMIASVFAFLLAVSVFVPVFVSVLVFERGG